MSFQVGAAFVLVEGTKEATGFTLKLMSNRPKRFASRRPSRPKPEGVVLPVARTKELGLMLDIAARGNVITDVGCTLPLWAAKAVGIRPKPTLAVLPAPVP